MRHRKDHRKLSRTASHRRALLRNLVTALFEYERIETTVAKAKEARRLAERLITFAKRGDLAARRHVARFVMRPAVTAKLFATIAPWYAERHGRLHAHHPDRAPPRRRRRDGHPRAGEVRRAEGQGAQGPHRHRPRRARRRSRATRRRSPGRPPRRTRRRARRRSPSAVTGVTARAHRGPAKKRTRTGVKTG